MNEQIIGQVVEDAAEPVVEAAQEVVAKVTSNGISAKKGIIAIAILGLGVGGYILYQRHKNSKKSQKELSEDEKIIEGQFEVKEEED